METIVYLGLVKWDFTKIKGDWLVSKPLHIIHQVAEKETFFFLMCVCGVCVHILSYAPACVCGCACVHMGSEARDLVLEVFLHLIHWSRVSPLNSELVDKARLPAGSEDPISVFGEMMQKMSCQAHLPSLWVQGNPNSCPSVSMAGTLTVYPSPPPNRHILEQ